MLIKRLRAIYLTALALAVNLILWLAHFASDEAERPIKAMSRDDVAAFIGRFLMRPVEMIRDAQYHPAHALLAAAHAVSKGEGAAWAYACERAEDVYGPDAVSRVCKDHEWPRHVKNRRFYI